MSTQTRKQCTNFRIASANQSFDCTHYHLQTVAWALAFPSNLWPLRSSLSFRKSRHHDLRSLSQHAALTARQQGLLFSDLGDHMCAAYVQNPDLPVCGEHEAFKLCKSFSNLLKKHTQRDISYRSVLVCCRKVSPEAYFIQCIVSLQLLAEINCVHFNTSKYINFNVSAMRNRHKDHIGQKRPCFISLWEQSWSLAHRQGMI